MSSAMSAVVSIGGAREAPGVDDVFKVAHRISQLDLDDKNLSRIRKESPKPSAFQAEAAPAECKPSEDGEGQACATGFLSPERTRIALCCTLKRLATGSSGVRDVILTGLAGLVNGTHAVLKKTATDQQALQFLCAAFHGEAAALQLSDSDLNAAFGGSPPGLSAEEHAQLVAGLPVTTGLMCISVTQLQTFLSTCTATLAVSCEALRASTKPFDPKLIEAGQNAVAIAAAGEVLSLLDGSNQVNAKPRDGGAGEVRELTQVCHSNQHALQRDCRSHSVVAMCPVQVSLTVPPAAMRKLQWRPNAS